MNKEQEALKTHLLQVAARAQELVDQLERGVLWPAVLQAGMNQVRCAVSDASDAGRRYLDGGKR